jgi:hypothetical protein
VEEIGGFKMEQQTRFGGQWCDGERVRARRSRGGNGGSVSPLCRREREVGGGNGWVRSGRQRGCSLRRSAAGQGTRLCAACGGHTATTACDCRWPGVLNLWMEAGNNDWQPKFELLYLLI